MQGNCSPEAVGTALLQQLPSLISGRVHLPPLKPLQCLLLTQATPFLSVKGSLWIDNLYLSAVRRYAAPELSMIQYAAEVELDPESRVHVVSGEVGQPMFVTNTTFVGEGRGSVRAIDVRKPELSVLVQGAQVL